MLLAFLALNFLLAILALTIENYLARKKKSWSSCHGSAVSKPDQHPCGHGFNPCFHSVGKGSGIAVSCGVGHTQTWLGSRIAVALVQASGCSSNWTASLRTSILHGGRKRLKKKKKDKTNLGNCKIYSHELAFTGIKKIQAFMTVCFHDLSHLIVKYEKST